MPWNYSYQDSIVLAQKQPYKSIKQNREVRNKPTQLWSINLWQRRLKLDWGGGAVLRWQRNRTGRPLSPPQIHQKNISMLSRFYKATSECWQRTSGTQKSRSLSSKTGRKNIKHEKRDKGGRKGAPSREGSLKKRKVSPNTRKHSPCQVCGEPWKHRGQHNREEK